MATATHGKPFSPEETQRILKCLQQPAVFLNMTCGWPVLHWTAEYLLGCLGQRLMRFRLGRKEEASTPLFETQCSYVEATMAQFLNWTRNQIGTDVGPFSDYPSSEYWAYADYKYIAMLFQEQPHMFEDVKWSEFGFDGRNGKESTLWIGTKGANTPCHLDSYGYNLVLQVQGRKCWHLFPPEDSSKLYPTRIPYEESSIFSQVNVLHPDIRRFPAFQTARAHTVTLQPGQVLYVPRHWWHYVESMDPITISVNSWIELEGDDMARVSEAVTKAVVFAFKSAPTDDNADNWLNPTEEGLSTHDENMQYLNLAVMACAQRQRNKVTQDPERNKLTQDPKDTHTVKRDSSGKIKRNELSVGESVGVPFGPYLIPVCCQQDDSLTTRGMVPKDLEGKSSSDCAGKFQENCSISHYRTCGCGDGNLKDFQEVRHTRISTDDLLECLVHPDIVARVTERLLERHAESHRASL